MDSKIGKWMDGWVEMVNEQRLQEIRCLNGGILNWCEACAFNGAGRYFLG